MKLTDLNTSQTVATSKGVETKRTITYNCPGCNNPAYSFSITVTERGLDDQGNLTVLNPIHHSHEDKTKPLGKCEVTFVIKKGQIVRV